MVKNGISLEFHTVTFILQKQNHLQSDKLSKQWMAITCWKSKRNMVLHIWHILL